MLAASASQISRCTLGSIGGRIRCKTRVCFVAIGSNCQPHRHQVYHQHPLCRNFSTKETPQLVSITDHLDELHKIPLADVRNFCIIAHVDHGKSSLASRLLEYTGNLGHERQATAHQLGEKTTSEYNQDETSAITSNNTASKEIATKSSKHKEIKEEITLLDTLKVERERGITVKASAASMLYKHPCATNEHGWILLNMVDTPGHADFGVEVSKSLSSIEGAVLLFDSVQGVQAQTLSVYDKARALGKQILPALTKIDIPSARPLEVALAVSDLFAFDPDTIMKTSARNRIGVREVLDSVCENVPPPSPLSDDDGNMLRAKVIDSWFEPRRGVVCLVRLLSGTLSENDRISIVEPSIDGTGPKVGKDTYSVQEIGLVMPDRIRTGKLGVGQMGYVVAGLRDPREARPGSIMSLQKTMQTLISNQMELPSSAALTHQSVLYASVHPMEGDGFDEMHAAVNRLALNDTGLEIHQTAGSSNNGGGPFLGPGLRVGFQGLLHVEVFRQRLLDEFDLEAIVTPPKVPYRIQYLESKNYKRPPGAPMEEVIEDLADWPAQGHRFKVLEPMVDVRILAPMEYAGSIMELTKRKRGKGMQTKPIDENIWLFTAAMPWADVVTDFHDDLKSTTAGYASFDVSEADPPQQEADLVKVELLLNSEVVDPLAFVCHRDVAQSQARVVCQKLQEVLPRQQFVTVIQAKADGKIIASSRIKAYRKDVLTKAGKTVGGGDITRKRKLLEKQKKGKKRQQATGKVQLSQAAFNSVISRS
eukprot:scaffold6846_cov164-Skeletonema_menzelii.AAC.2